MKAESWLQGSGVAILLMLSNLWPHISPKHIHLYHSLLPENHVYWAIAVQLGVVCVLATFVLSIIEKLPPRVGPYGPSLWWAILGASFIASVHGSMIRLTWINARSLTPEFTFAICAGIAVALGFLKPSFYVRLSHAIRVALALLGLSIFWIMPELLYMAIHPEPHEQVGFIRPIPKAKLPQRRIVWVLFDELSQDQVFDHRHAGIDLPAFDRLRAESLTFTDVQPVGYYTGLVLPSLLLGRDVTSERSDLDGQLSVKSAEGSTNQLADQSIFADARRQGWTTGVAGWYNPYCRTYATQLDRCHWIYSDPLPGGFDARDSIWANILAPIRPLLLALTGRTAQVTSDIPFHANDYSQLMTWSQQLIADEDIQLVFLHLPIPHAPTIYNRHSRTLGAAGSYLDNLVLADHALSQISQWIAATRSASLTTLVVSSDHSWRVPMWSKNAVWTAEDDRASSGKFDPRPVLMVRLPRETEPSTVSQPFFSLKEHDLIEDLLKNEPTMQTLEASVGDCTAADCPMAAR